MHGSAAEAEVVTSVCDIAITFPILPVNPIDRSYILDTLDDIFSARIDGVILEGASEIGKTVLCAQFARRHGACCFSVFLGPYKDLSSDPAQVRYDLANQIHWYIKGARIPAEQDVTPELYRNLLLILQRKIKEANQFAYFVVDGLEVVGAASTPETQYLLTSLLPIGTPRFRFLLSGDQSLLADSIKEKFRTRSQTVSFFSPAETAKYFSDIEMPDDVAADIHKTTRGLPGRLATVRRLIESGISPSQVLDVVGDAAKNIFEPEWSRIDPKNELQVLVVAAIAFLTECRVVSTLAEIARSSPDSILECIRPLTFLTVSGGALEVAFVSDAFQKFARNRLSGKEAEITQRAVERLHGTVDPAEAIRLLPQYLSKTQDFEQLERLLSGDGIALAVRASRSITPVINTLDQVRKMAATNAPDALGVRCAIARVVLAQALSPDHIGNRIRALVVAGQDSLAISMANRAETEEQRLLLLSILLSEQQNKGKSPADEVVSEVSRLSSTVDISCLGDMALDVAANIVQTKPDVAARIVEGYAKAEGDPNALDSALVRVSLTAIKRAKDEVEVERIVSGVDKAAVSENAKRFSRSAKVLISADSPEQVLAQVEALPTTSEKIFFLRSWIRGNAHKALSVGVSLGASKIILADTKYIASATVFRDLSLPLVYATEGEVSQQLMSFLQGQCVSAKMSGPLVDYFRLKFRLARARVAWYGESALSELMDDALEVDSVEDVDSRAACYAWLARCVQDIGPENSSNLKIELMEYASGLLMQTVDALLDSCAEHEVAAKGAIQAVASYSVDDALSIAGRLNTKTRRELGRCYVFERMLLDAKQSEFVAIVTSMHRILQQIDARDMKQAMAIKFLDWVAEEIDDLDEGRINAALDAVKYVFDPDLRVRALAGVLGACGKDVPEAVREGLTSRLMESWAQTEDDGLKVDVGNEALVRLGSRSPEASRKLSKELGDFVQIRGQRLALQSSWQYLTLLYGRGLAALAATRCLNKAALTEFLSAAENVLSAVERARLLARCSLLISRYDPAFAREMISDHVLPLIGSCSTNSKELTTEVERMLTDSSPALWLLGVATLRQYLARLSIEMREAALNAVLGYILHAKIPGEPWNRASRKVRDLRESVVNDAMEVMNLATSDALIAAHLCDLLVAVMDPVVGSRLNKVQKANVAQRAKVLSESKFPDPNGISHNGYSILIRGHIFAVNRVRLAEWAPLIEEAKLIPNSSDRCYVLARLVPLTPAKHDSFRSEVLEECLRVWASLQTLSEKVDRFDAIFESCRAEMGPRAKEMINTCLKGLSPETEGQAGSRYKNLVEIAYKIDEEWAASLVSATDNDPAKMIMMSEAKSRVEILDLSRRLVGSDAEDHGDDAMADITAACWRELGFVNASHGAAQDWVSLVGKLSGSQMGSFADSYPVIALIFASFALRYEGISNMADKARDLVRYIQGAVALARSMTSAKGSQDPGRVVEELDVPDPLEMVSGSGDRAAIVAALQKWLGQQRMSALDVIDPFLSISEVVELLVMVRRVHEDCEVRVLTSRKGQVSDVDEPAIRASIEREWGAHGSGDTMPPLVLHIVGRASDGDMGIHDRWWLSDAVGLDIGTSFGGLGAKISRIRSLDEAGVAQVRSRIDPYFRMTQKFHGGERLLYKSVVM